MELSVGRQQLQYQLSIDQDQIHIYQTLRQKTMKLLLIKVFLIIKLDFL